jgi:hypothetical protein
MIVAVFSDLHVGSTVGLWPGRHRIEGGGVYEANVMQQWLLECWQDALRQVAEVRPDVIVINGDAIQGGNWKDGQLVSSKADIQQLAAYELLAPLRETTDAMYYIRGTEWHDGRAAENVEMLARSLDCVKDPASDQWSWWELFLALGTAELRGAPVAHFAHHVGMSSVPWYEATVPLRDALMELAELWRFYGVEAPNLRLVVRSHRHRFIHVQAPPDLQVFVTPSWQLKTAFAHKRASAMLPQIGWVQFEYDGTDLVIKPRIYALPRLHVETIA